MHIRSGTRVRADHQLSGAERAKRYKERRNLWADQMARAQREIVEMTDSLKVRIIAERYKNRRGLWTDQLVQALHDIIEATNSVAIRDIATKALVKPSLAIPTG